MVNDLIDDPELRGWVDSTYNDWAADFAKRSDPSRVFPLAIVVPDASQMASAARAAGTPVVREAFADRRYNADGSLVSRKEAGSLLTVDEAADQAEMLARERAVVARDGSRVRVAFDTICIHADMENAVERLRAIRKRLGGIR